MIRKFLTHLFFVCLAVLWTIRLWAVPAYPWPVTVTQPDGTVVTLQSHGDEWCNWVTTQDGYTVMRNDQGYWCYVLQEGPRSVLTSCVARDDRTLAETEFLMSSGKLSFAVPRALHAQDRPHRLYHMDTSFDRKGIILLVNFNDRKFASDSASTFFGHLVNKPNFTEYTDYVTHEHVQCTGSVRDYFTDNTLGLYQPEFEVVGPIDVSFSQYDIHKGENSQALLEQALTAADEYVDFSQFDGDGDGFIDMVYLIVAGYGSNYAGNDPNLLWPHMSAGYMLASMFPMYYPDPSTFPRYDGVCPGMYACSTEFFGVEGTETVCVDGIGTMCHELSHVLNLPDLYDTNGATFGQSNDPKLWSIMASGTYLNKSRTPAGYSIYERLSLGIIQPTILQNYGTYRLETDTQAGNNGFRLNTTDSTEFFLIENRQQNRWDQYLPGHGMLVWRVDSMLKVWETNQVNQYAQWNALELLRARDIEGTMTDDPFPGTAQVTSLLNTATRPTLRYWGGEYDDFPTRDSRYCLYHITEHDGKVSFSTYDGDLESFEQFPTSVADTANLRGNLATWQIINGMMVDPDSIWGFEHRAVALTRGGILETTIPVEGETEAFGLDIYNPNSFVANLQAYVSVDNGTTWQLLADDQGETKQRVAAGTIKVARWHLPDPTDSILLKFTTTTGIAGKYTYVDNVTVKRTVHQTRPDVTGDGIVDIADVNAMLGKSDNALADVTSDGKVDIADVNATINAMLGKQVSRK